MSKAEVSLSTWLAPQPTRRWEDDTSHKHTVLYMSLFENAESGAGATGGQPVALLECCRPKVAERTDAERTDTECTDEVGADRVETVIVTLDWVWSKDPWSERGAWQQRASGRPTCAVLERKLEWQRAKKSDEYAYDLLKQLDSRPA
jgi:hypothetical protein